MCKTNKNIKSNCAKCQYAANSKLALLKFRLKTKKIPLQFLENII
jgi:hypothetical protein